jgi:uncharacterized membrane protein
LDLDEGKILEGKCSFGNMSKGKAILTSKRLVIFQKKGWINETWKKLVEIPLEEIVECYSESRTITGWYMKFRVKGGDWGMITFPSTGSNLLVGGVYGHEKSQKAVIDRWVTAINLAREKLQKKPEKPIDVLQLRFAKGEISKEEYEEMKKVLEGHLNE